MSDDSQQRRDAWRNAQAATTVAGDRVHDRVPPREHEGEDIHLPDTAQVPKPTESGRRNTLTRADGQDEDHDPVDQPVVPHRRADPEEHRKAMSTSPQYRLQMEGVVRPRISISPEDFGRLAELCGGFDDRGRANHPPEFTSSEQDRRLNALLRHESAGRGRITVELEPADEATDEAEPVTTEEAA